MKFTRVDVPFDFDYCRDMNDVEVREKYHGQLAAFHRISVAAMKSAQSLDPAATDELVAAIEVVAPWYPPSP